jgi:septum formation protein
MGIYHRVVSVDVDETPVAGEAPRQYVERLARAKARAGWARVAGQPTLGADTAVVLHGEVLGKPLDQTDAVRMLLALAGRTHQVLTGVAIAYREREVYRLSVSKVYLRQIGETEAIAYWRTGEPADKAGGYAIQGRGAVFVRRIEGSYSGVVGLPLHDTAELLNELGLVPGRMQR